MAICRVPCLCFLAALAQAATLHPVEELGSSIVRRQKSTRVHLGPAGEIDQESKASADLVEIQRKNPGQPLIPGVNPWCNAYYPLGEERTNTCTKGEHIESMEDCEHAAKALKFIIPTLITDPPNQFETDEWKQNPLPRPKACFVSNGTAHFNPSGSAYNESYDITEGTPICTDRIYKDGSVQTGSLAGVTKADLCPSGYTVIDNWEECEWAHDCVFGGMYCEQLGAANDAYQTEDRTPGCFRNTIGCVGFNAKDASTMSDWTVVNATPVCRLESYNFTGHPKYSISANGL